MNNSEAHHIRQLRTIRNLMRKVRKDLCDMYATTDRTNLDALYDNLYDLRQQEYFLIHVKLNVPTYYEVMCARLTLRRAKRKF